jgi:hypothetical protein
VPTGGGGISADCSFHGLCQGYFLVAKPFEKEDTGIVKKFEINCLFGFQNNNLLVSGSQDGTAKLWNPNSGKCVGTLMAGKGQEGAL